MSIARYFQVERGWNCLVVERGSRYGTGISSRNSEVIHAGIYYPTASLKARLCTEGKVRLYHYLAAHELPYRRCGKLILAAPVDESRLADLESQGRANGVDDLQRLSAADVQSQYPALSPFPALHSPSTGILAADGLMRQLVNDYRAAGGDLALRTTFAGANIRAGIFELEMIDSDEGVVKVRADRVVNAAGLHSFDVAKLAGFDYEGRGYELRFCKGSYFKVPESRKSFRHLIYPLPGPIGLGIHIRLDMQDEILLGPDAEYLPDLVEDYTVDSNREGYFRDQVTRYWPAVNKLTLLPDWAGIRPHIYLRNSFQDDFQILNGTDHGLPGWINMFGIDSPGLTSALAFGPYLASLWS